MQNVKPSKGISAETLGLDVVGSAKLKLGSETSVSLLLGVCRDCYSAWRSRFYREADSSAIFAIDDDVRE